MKTPIRDNPIRDGKVLSWATDLDAKTMAQAHRTAGLSFVREPLALMPDAHLGMGATVGSVVATEGSIIPAAVGVDIGCGMIAQKTVFTREQVDPYLTKIHSGIAKAVPSGPADNSMRIGAQAQEAASEESPSTDAERRLSCDRQARMPWS